MSGDPESGSGSAKGPLNEELCPHCKILIKYKRDFRRHLLTHAENVDALKTVCPYQGCFYKALQRSNVVNHARKKHGIEIAYCQVSLCPYSALDEQSVIEHVKEAHPLETYKRKRRRPSVPLPGPRVKVPRARRARCPLPSPPASPQMNGEPFIFEETPSAPALSLGVPGYDTMGQFAPQPGSAVHNGNLTYQPFVSPIPGAGCLIQEADYNGYLTYQPLVPIPGTGCLIQEEAESWVPKPIVPPDLWNLQEIVSASTSPQLSDTTSQGTTTTTPLSTAVSSDPSTPSDVSSGMNFEVFLQRPLAPFSIDDLDLAIFSGGMDYSQLAEIGMGTFNDKTSAVEAGRNSVLETDALTNVASYFLTSPELVDPLVDFGFY